MIDFHMGDIIGNPMKKYNRRTESISPQNLGMNTLGQRLKACRKEAMLTQEVVCARTGIKQGTLSELENDKYPTSSFVPHLAALYGVEALWLAEGKEPKHRGLLLSSNTKAEEIRAKSRLIDLSNHPDLVAIPRVKFKLSAGVSGFAIEQEGGEGRPIFFRKDWVQANNYKPEELFGVRVTGSSMETSLWDGDLVVVNTADVRPRDGECFAINFEGELVVKRLRKDAGVWWATSDNADQRRYPPKQCTEDVILIGRTVYKQSERI